MATEQWVERARTIGEGWTNPAELAWLFNTASQMAGGADIIEIGAWKGQSTLMLYAGASKHCRVITIDTWQGSPNEMHAHGEAREKDLYAEFLANMRNHGFEPEPFSGQKVPGCYYIVGDSVEQAQMWAAKTVDWIFIDGDHYRVGEDIDAWLPKVKSGGIISGHDYFCFYDYIQRAIHQRLGWIHEIHYSIWLRYWPDRIL